MAKRKIALITGTRADYGYLLPVIERMAETKGLALQLIVTGMHLSPRHGNTYRLIERDGFKIAAKVPMLSAAAGGRTYMPDSVGAGVSGLAAALERLSPDLLFVFGDRIEALAGAIAGSYMNLPVAHMHGGDRSKGDLDERVRHAITKLSHLHFPATRRSAERIARLGENAEYIFPVGSTTLDAILRYKYKTRRRLAADLGLDGREFIVVLQNPVTTEPEESYRQMRETLLALRSYPDLRKIVVRPNADSGYLGIEQAINEFERELDLKVFVNLSRTDYLSLLKHARALVGNSSSGIIEAPSFKLPVINVGIRQEGRERSANVIDAPHERAAIARALQRALGDRVFLSRIARCVNPYGDGRASARVVRILKSVRLDKDLLQKQITY